MGQQSVRHPVFARLYARLSVKMEPELSAFRRRLTSGLSGQVIEIGAGNGLNFSYYPATATRVVAVEPEPHLRAIAERNATRAPCRVEVIDGTAEQLAADDESFDAAVVSLLLCSVHDPPAALAEIHRVLRPGGQLRFFEHVQAESAGLRRAQRWLDAAIWPRIAGGCHTGRDTIATITGCGFILEDVERLRFPDVCLPLPTSPHVLGAARRSNG
ncbi:MAG: class I SAM-dependent methyltransferase [Nocardioidaceae bacterium]|nr:class I SAM-dependent methyltransferase [Nocardioidaceae bacterium]